MPIKSLIHAMPYKRKNGNYAITGTDIENKRYDIAVHDENICQKIARLLQADYDGKVGN